MSYGIAATKATPRIGSSLLGVGACGFSQLDNTAVIASPGKRFAFPSAKQSIAPRCLGWKPPAYVRTLDCFVAEGNAKRFPGLLAMTAASRD